MRVNTGHGAKQGEMVLLRPEVRDADHARARRPRKVRHRPSPYLRDEIWQIYGLDPQTFARPAGQILADRQHGRGPASRRTPEPRRTLLLTAEVVVPDDPHSGQKRGEEQGRRVGMNDGDPVFPYEGGQPAQRPEVERPRAVQG